MTTDRPADAEELPEAWAYVSISAQGWGNDTRCVHCGDYMDVRSRHSSDAAFGPEWFEPCDENDGAPHELDREQRFRCINGSIPETVRGFLTVERGPTDQRFPDDDDDQWSGWLSREAWEALRDDWCIEPEFCSQTMGIMAGPDEVRGENWFQPMWALAYESPGTDWNMGGVYPVDWVQMYFNSRDEDVMAAAGITDQEESND